MSTPNDFLERLKTHFRFEPIIEGLTHTKSDKFTELTKKEFDQFETSIKEKYKNSVEDDTLVLKLIEEVTPILTPIEAKALEKCAFGKIYNTKMNAFCAKSKDGYDNYCVVINEGLLMLLHKYGKLLIAQSNPKNVLFCNYNNFKKFTRDNYRELANELIQNYKDYKAPVGAKVKLTPESNMGHGFSLHFQELFVLCHELGHIFNKDLEDKENLMDLFGSEISVLEENKFHEKEFKADLYAFDLISRVIENKYEKKHILSYVIMLFDIMAIIKPTDSKKHPAPIDRILNIVYENWGEKSAENYIKSYESKSAYEHFFNNL